MLNEILAKSPSWLQYLFMERVMQIVKESSSQANQVLQSEKKGGVRSRRRYQPLAPVRVVQLAVLRVQEAYRQICSKA